MPNQGGSSFLENCPVCFGQLPFGVLVEQVLQI